jgi:hypothetical protein
MQWATVGEVLVNINQRGFSLVNTFVSIGLFGVLALAGVNLVKQQVRTQEMITVAPNLVFIVDDIRSLLSSPQVCTQNLENHNARYQEVQRLFNAERLLYETETRLQKAPDIIVRRMTLTEEDHEVNVMAGTTHLILNFYHVPTQTQFNRRIRLHVALDQHLRITSCFTTGGIHRGEGSDSISHWSVGAGTPHLHYSQGPLIVDGLESAQLQNIEQLALQTREVQLGHGESTDCESRLHGALRFNRSARQLEFCSNKTSSWTILSPPTLSSWGQEDFEFSSTQSLQRRFTLNNWNFCSLMSWSLRDGGCRLQSVGSRAWILETIQERGTPITCRVRCFRRPD